MFSLCLLPWEASLMLLVPRGCPGGARPAPVLAGRSQQGCPSHPSSVCQCPVRPLGCICRNRADTLNVVAKAVFFSHRYPSRFPCWEALHPIFSWHGFTGANRACSKHPLAASDTLCFLQFEGLAILAVVLPTPPI